jgi:hypothetical protein
MNVRAGGKQSLKLEATSSSDMSIDFQMNYKALYTRRHNSSNKRIFSKYNLYQRNATSRKVAASSLG